MQNFITLFANIIPISQKFPGNIFGFLIHIDKLIFFNIYHADSVFDLSINLKIFFTGINFFYSLPAHFDTPVPSFLLQNKCRLLMQAASINIARDIRHIRQF